MPIRNAGDRERSIFFVQKPEIANLTPLQLNAQALGHADCILAPQSTIAVAVQLSSCGWTFMHAIDLAELSIVVARHAPAMIAHRCAPPRPAQQQYWLESKYRHDYWSGRLASHRQELQKIGVSYRRQCWLRILPMLEEILISEVLTRTIAYWARLLEHRQVDCDFATLANSVLSSHIEARHRCLHLLVFGEGLSVDHSVRMNRLRRRLETLTDSVLASLEPIESGQSICFDAFWTDHTRSGLLDSTRQHPCTVSPRGLHLDCLLQSLRPTIGERLFSTSHGSASNHKIFVATLGFFPNSLFDSFGVPVSEATAYLTANSLEGTAAMEFFHSAQSSSITHLMTAQRPGRASATEDRRFK